MTKTFIAALMITAALPLSGCGQAEDTAAAKKQASAATAAKDEADRDAAEAAKNDPWAKTMADKSDRNGDQGQGTDADFNVSGGESDNDGEDGGEVAVEENAPDVVEQGPVSNAQQ